LKRKKSVIKSAGEIGLLATAVVIERCMQKIERHQTKLIDREAATKRKLAVTSIIYHALGIFYNE